MDSRSNQRKKLRVGFHNNAEVDGDRISNLPESVLCHILSHLPTKVALRTSVLSKAWEHKWTCMYNLKFDDRLRYTQESMPKKEVFMGFVDRVITNCTISMVKEFELLIQTSYSSSRVKTWISALLRLNNLGRLHIWQLHGRGRLELPRCFYTCESLTEVKLCRFTFKLPPVVCLPNLRVLHLREIAFVKGDASCSTEVLFSFPVLESFRLEEYKGLNNVKKLKIDAPLLTNFVMVSRSFQYSKRDDRLNHCEIEICVGKVKKFACSDLLFHTFIWSGEPPSGPVDISVKHTCTAAGNNQNYLQYLKKHITFPVFRILKRLSACIRYMELPAHVVETLAYAEPPFDFPIFDRLCCIKVSGEYFSENMNVAVINLLKMAPALGALILNKFRKCAPLYGGNSEATESLPTCALPRLKIVKFERFGGTEEEHGLVNCLLKRALVLKKLFFATKHLGDVKSKTENQLLMFHKVSSNLSINLI